MFLLYRLTDIAQEMLKKNVIADKQIVPSSETIRVRPCLYIALRINLIRLFQKKIHIPPTDGKLEILVGGGGGCRGSRALDIQVGGGLQLKILPRGSF